MSEIDPGLAAFALLAVCALVVVVVLVRGARRPSEPAKFYDEGSTKIENQPWSPTRGHYFFATADLPAVYLEGERVRESALVQCFAEDEVDARARIKDFLSSREGVTVSDVMPDVTGPVYKFRPLLKRKGQ